MLCGLRSVTDLLLRTVSSSGTWPQTGSSLVGPWGGPPGETSPPCVPMEPNGFGTGSGSVPRMGGTWPASTWGCCPSSASWCPPSRKCRVQGPREEPSGAHVCPPPSAGSTGTRGRRGTWTARCPCGFCCSGWQETPATWWARFWQTSFPFR